MHYDLLVCNFSLQQRIHVQSFVDKTGDLTSDVMWCDVLVLHPEHTLAEKLN